MPYCVPTLRRTVAFLMWFFHLLGVTYILWSGLYCLIFKWWNNLHSWYILSLSQYIEFLTSDYCDSKIFKSVSRETVLKISILNNVLFRFLIGVWQPQNELGRISSFYILLDRFISDWYFFLNCTEEFNGEATRDCSLLWGKSFHYTFNCFNRCKTILILTFILNQFG